MKKSVGIALAFSVVAITISLNSCGTTDTAAKSAEAVSNNVTIQLESNPTTGYSWECEIDDVSVAVLSDQSYKEYEHAEGEVGVGGEESFTFEGKNAGETTVTFTYRRPFEEEGSEATSRTAKITVDKKLNTSVEFLGQ